MTSIDQLKDSWAKCLPWRTHATTKNWRTTDLCWKKKLLKSKKSRKTTILSKQKMKKIKKFEKKIQSQITKFLRNVLWIRYLIFVFDCVKKMLKDIKCFAFRIFKEIINCFLLFCVVFLFMLFCLICFRSLNLFRLCLIVLCLEFSKESKFVVLFWSCVDCFRIRDLFRFQIDLINIRVFVFFFDRLLFLWCEFKKNWKIFK